MNGFAQRGVDSAFRLLGRTAVFRPTAKQDVRDVLVILRQADVGIGPLGTSLTSEATVIDVRVSDVAAPRRGDSFIVDGVTHTINANPMRLDDMRLVWTCPTPEGE